MQAFENLWISRAFFNKRVAHNYDIVMHTLAISIKKSMFGTHYIWFGVSKLPPEYITIHYWGHTEWNEKCS